MAVFLTRQCQKARILHMSQFSFLKFSTLTNNQIKSDNYSLARPFKDIPGPPGLPFFGSILQLKKEGGIDRLPQIMEKRFEKYGPIYKEKILGKTVVYTNDATAAETIFRADGKYPDRPMVLPNVHKENTIPNHLVNIKGHEGQRLRSGMAPKMMTPKLVQENMDNFNAVTGDFIERLRKCGNDSVIVVKDLLAQLLDWGTESVATFMFGTRFGLYENPPPPETKRFMKVAHQINLEIFPTFSTSSPISLYFKTGLKKKFVEAKKTACDIVEKMANERLEELIKDVSAQGRENILGQSLLSYVMSKKELSLTEFCSLATDMFVAGVDTTAYTSQWLLYHLARNPDVQEKLFQELEPLLQKTGFLSADDLAKIPYLKASMKESQRMSPLLTNHFRTLQKDVVLCGYEIPSGTEVRYSSSAACRSDKYFKEADKFIPERWLRSEAAEKINPFVMLTFGHGPRMCIGRRVAEAEMFSLISKLIGSFKVRTLDDEKVNATFKGLVVPGKPIGFVFTERA